MSDLKLITARQPGIQEAPTQEGQPDEFFGEQSNDLQLDSINDFATISGIDKLKQDINKIMLTERGTNTNFPLYGTTLQSMIGTKVNFLNLKAKVKDEIISSLQILQFINKDNPDPDERLDTLEFLSIEQPSIDSLDIKINVITESGKRIATGVVLNI
jgi:hypothetical protein